MCQSLFYIFFEGVSVYLYENKARSNIIGQKNLTTKRLQIETRMHLIPPSCPFAYRFCIHMQIYFYRDKWLGNPFPFVLLFFSLSSTPPKTEQHTDIDQYPEECHAECQEKDHHIYTKVSLYKSGVIKIEAVALLQIPWPKLSIEVISNCWQKECMNIGNFQCFIICWSIVWQKLLSTSSSIIRTLRDV